MRRLAPILAVIALVAAFAGSVRADKIKLRDGTTIEGTIVGFEDNAFKVKTSYGFALVQKDQVVSIVVAEPDKKADADKKPDAERKLEAENKPEAVGEKAPAVTPKPSKIEFASAATPAAASTLTGSPAANGPASATTATTAKPAATSPPATANSSSPPSPKPASPAAASATAATPASTTSKPTPAGAPPAAATAPSSATVAKNSPTPAVAAVAPPPKPPEPEPVPEEVSGNTYMNRTWGFQMYKPPDWQVIEGARSVLPGAITAMGTSDQKTYLLIAQETVSKSIASDMDAIEGRLRDVLENYRSLGEKRVTVSGLPAIQHKFRGSIDNHEWSGIVVFIPRDSHLYTIFGMTYADSDLVQIQENIISRAISSLQFTKQ